MINLSSLLLIFSLLFQGYTKKWQGSDNPGHSYASFEEFNGKQSFSVKLGKNSKFYLKYSVLTAKGKLHLTIKSKSKVVFDKDLLASDSGELNIENAKGEDYKFVFVASHAKGSFDVSYKSL